MDKIKRFLNERIAGHLSFYVFMMMGAMLLSLGILTISILNMSSQRAYTYKNYEVDSIFENFRQVDMAYALEKSDGLVEYIEFLNAKKQIKEEAGSPHNFGFQYSEQAFQNIIDKDKEFMVYYPYKNSSDVFIVRAPKLAGPTPIVDILIYHSLGFVLILVVLITLFLFQLHYQYVRPILLMKAAVEQIGSGDYQIDIDYVSDNELNVLKNSIKEMGSTIDRQLTALHQAEQERKRIILAMSHDIRTPLTNISGYSETLKNGFDLSENDKENAIDVIYNNTQRAKELINGLFDYAKYDSDQFKVVQINHDIVGCLQKTLIDYYPELEAKGIVLDMQIPEEPIVVTLDKSLFERLIGNLLTNTIRYAHSDGTLTVAMEANANRIHIILQDEGPGIPKDIQETLFQPFVTGDEARSNRTGTGLGLAIAKRLTERIGGFLEWDKSYTEGVRWRITLQCIYEPNEQIIPWNTSDDHMECM